jgi:hypothetical protein
MAVTSVGSGTQLAVISTEHTLDTETTAAVYVLVVDLSNMAIGDSLTLRMKTKVASGKTSRLAFERIFSHEQIEPNVYSSPVPIDTELVCTLTQTAGTGRNFDWNLLKIS